MLWMHSQRRSCRSTPLLIGSRRVWGSLVPADNAVWAPRIASRPHGWGSRAEEDLPDKADSSCSGVFALTFGTNRAFSAAPIDRQPFPIRGAAKRIRGAFFSDVNGPRHYRTKRSSQHCPKPPCLGLTAIPRGGTATSTGFDGEIIAKM